MKIYRAYCYRSGQIMIGPALPEGTLLLAEGSYRLLRRAVDVYLLPDGCTRLVPGIAEAANEDAENEAYGRACVEIRRRIVDRRRRDRDAPRLGV